ncbi:hypothetical protein BJY01DRAFT_97110 [Aspergillus pseudoustus]|uniref:Uncharacterized protein n=1 Tax=Aspergillus pseudoustus TaxID=1810923 RepID=A0ABR4IZN7_9EURO
MNRWRRLVQMGAALSATQQVAASHKIGTESMIANVNGSGAEAMRIQPGAVADGKTDENVTVSETVEAMRQQGHHERNATSLVKHHVAESALVRIIDGVAIETTGRTYLRSTKDVYGPLRLMVDNSLHHHLLLLLLPLAAQTTSDAGEVVGASHETVIVIETVTDPASATTHAKVAAEAALTASADDRVMRADKAMVVTVGEEEASAPTRTSVLVEEGEVDYTMYMKTCDVLPLSPFLSFLCFLISLFLDFSWSYHMKHCWTVLLSTLPYYIYIRGLFHRQGACLYFSSLHLCSIASCALSIDVDNTRSAAYQLQIRQVRPGCDCCCIRTNPARGHVPADLPVGNADRLSVAPPPCSPSDPPTSSNG